MPSYKSRKILVLQIWGKRGSKTGFFKVFSMRKPSLPKGTTKVHTLVPCSCLHTFVLDGRDGKTQIQEIKIDSEKMNKNYNKMVDIWSYILDISFWLYVSYAVFMISNKLSLWLSVSNTIFLISNKMIANSPF